MELVTTPPPPGMVLPAPTAEKFLKRAESELMARSFEDFFRRYFSHYMTRGETKFHQFLFGVADRLARTSERYNIVGSKETAKSTIITLAAVLFVAANSWKHYVVIMSNPNTLEDHALAIVRELTTNRLLLSDFGTKIAPKKDIKNQTESFKDEAIILRNDTKIRFITPGQTVRGARHQIYRPDFFVGDDVHKASDFDSPYLLEKQFREVMGEAVGCLDIRLGSGIFLGNRADENGIQGKLSKMPNWKTSRWPIVDENGEYLGVTAEEAAHIKADVGDYVWRTDYMCEVVEDDRRIYNWENFVTFGREKIFWEMKNETMFRTVCGDWIESVCVTLDPSRGFNRQKPAKDRNGDLDNAAVVVNVAGKSGDTYTIAAEVLRDDPYSEMPFTDVQIEAMARACLIWGPNTLVIESNMFQELLRLDIERIFEKYGIPIRPIGEVSKIPKPTRIESLSGRIAQGRHKFCDDLPQEYKDEWGRFRVPPGVTKGHDDCMDATEVGIRYVTASSGEAWSFGPSGAA